MKKTLATLLILLATGSAFAADWQYVVTGNDVVVYVDNSSIRQQGKLTKYWTMFDYTKTQTTKGYQPKSYLSALLHNIVDCRNHQTANTQGVLYGGNFGAGETVQQFSIKLKSAVLAEPVPDTLGEAALDYACKHKSK